MPGHCIVIVLFSIVKRPSRSHFQHGDAQTTLVWVGSDECLSFDRWKLLAPHVAVMLHFQGTKNLWVGSAVYLGVWAERLFLCCTVSHVGKCRYAAFTINLLILRGVDGEPLSATQGCRLLLKRSSSWPFWASFWVQEKNIPCFFFHGPWLSIFSFCVLKRLGGGKTW